jgi:hypothetical protein
MVKLLIITLNTLISEDGTNSSHTYNLAKFKELRAIVAIV